MILLKPFFRDNIDEIYNLACPASPIHYQHNPIKTVKTCTIGVINILGLAKKNNSKILQASTSEVYGDPLFILRKKYIMVMLILLVIDHAMMKEKDVQKPFLWIILENIN